MIKNNYAFALHGGAGAIAGRDYTETEQHCAELAARCGKLLEDGASALDAIEVAVAELEACGLYVAGRGSAPNSAGYVELDASIMNGADRRAGAVAALTGFESPIRIARGVMEKTPHVMLAGNGVAAFASKHSYIEVSDPGSYYRLPVGVTADDLDAAAHGTVGAVALDQTGQLAAATSTGGTFGKLEGRVGDTPMIGPGTWADDDVAISFTGVGEHIIRSGGALAVALAFRNGATLQDAVQATLDEIARLGGDAGAIAISAAGETVMSWNSEGMKRASISSTEPLLSRTFE